MRAIYSNGWTSRLEVWLGHNGPTGSSSHRALEIAVVWGPEVCASCAPLIFDNILEAHAKAGQAKSQAPLKSLPGISLLSCPF